MKIIAGIETIDEIKPIFLEYLGHMSRFFEIKHFDSWCDGALKNLARYPMADDRQIYILKESTGIIGFSLVNKHRRFNPDGFAIADFFIQNNYQNKGHGRQLAEHVFSQFSENWEVAVSVKNKSALAFWEQVIDSYTGGHFIKKETAAFSGYGILFNTRIKNRERLHDRGPKKIMPASKHSLKTGTKPPKP